MSSGRWNFKLSDLRRATEVANETGRNVEVDVGRRVIRLVKPNESTDFSGNSVEPAGEVTL